MKFHVEADHPNLARAEETFSTITTAENFALYLESIGYENVTVIFVNE